MQKNPLNSPAFIIPALMGGIYLIAFLIGVNQPNPQQVAPAPQPTSTAVAQVELIPTATPPSLPTEPAQYPQSPLETPEASAASTANEAGETELRFVNVAQDIGLDFEHGVFKWGYSGDPIAMMGGGLCWIDFNNDNQLDLYVVNSYAQLEAGRWEQEEGGLPTSSLFENQNGQFVDVGEESGVGIPMRGNGCVAADFNVDGWTDLYVTTSRANLLFLNNQDGTFREVGDAAGAYAYGWQTGAVVGDVNRDGLPDLFVAGYVDINNQIEGSTMGFPNTNYGLRDLFFLHQGMDANGIPQFIEIGETIGLEDLETLEYGLGATFTDFDRDGDLDLFVANDTNPNRLYLNEYLPDYPTEFGFEFVEMGELSQVNDINSGMGVASGDVDGNGYFDLFVTNLGDQRHSFYRHEGSKGIPVFADATNDPGLENIGVGYTGWGTSWADFDNDGDLDLAVANGHVPLVSTEEAQALVFYENQSVQGDPGLIIDQSTTVGFDQIGDINGRGAAAADYDNDGDLDWAVLSVAGELILLENRLSSANNYITIAVKDGSMGVMVEARLADGSTISRELHVGSSYLSSEDPRIHLGVGENEKIDELIITWANRETASALNVPVNRAFSASPSGTIFPLVSEE